MGVIHLTVTAELRNPRVRVRFSGKTKTAWLGSVDTRYNSIAAVAVWWTGPLNKISSDSHTEKRKLIDETHIVFKDDNEYGSPLPTYGEAMALTDMAPVIQNGMLQPGTYDLPFMFRVPQILPPSFQWKDGHISYWLEATVDYKEGIFGKISRKKHNVKVPVVLDRYNLEHIVLPKSGVPASGSARRQSITGPSRTSMDTTRRQSIGGAFRSSTDTRRQSISNGPRPSIETTFSLGSATTAASIPDATIPSTQPARPRLGSRARLSFSGVPGSPNPELLSPPPMTPPLPLPESLTPPATTATAGPEIFSTSSGSESTLLAAESEPEPPTLTVPVRSHSPAPSITQVSFNPIPFSPLPLTRSTTNMSQNVQFTFSDPLMTRGIASALDPYDISTDCVVISNLHDTSSNNVRYRVSLPSRSFGPEDPIIAHVHVASIPSGCQIKYVGVTVKAEIEVRAHGFVKRTRTTIAEHKDTPANAGDYWRKTIRFHHKTEKPSSSSSSSTDSLGPSRSSFVSPLITVKHSLKIRFALDGAVSRSSRYVGMEVPIVLHVADSEAKRFLRDNGGDVVDGVTVAPLPAGGTVVSRLLEYDPFTRREGFAEQGGRFSIGLPLSRSVTW
ncbi:hypothetical protein HDV00_004229 [Rhizophlyctis rosea]|nr:hypothetical protein HDV00_004229 [Rhizophlyctis rosea]